MSGGNPLSEFIWHSWEWSYFISNNRLICGPSWQCNQCYCSGWTSKWTVWIQRRITSCPMSLLVSNLCCYGLVLANNHDNVNVSIWTVNGTQYLACLLLHYPLVFLLCWKCVFLSDLTNLYIVKNPSTMLVITQHIWNLGMDALRSVTFSSFCWLSSW